MTAFLRHLRLPLFVSFAAFLGACGDNTVNSSGSGGESTGGGGAGGTTGSTSSAGGTGGGSECGLICELPAVCDEGTCKTATELQLIVDNAILFEGGVATAHSGHAEVCARVHNEVPPDEILAEEGGCIAYGNPGPDPWTFVPVKAGNFTIESPNVGLVSIVSDGFAHCQSHYFGDGMNLAEGEGFAPGEKVTFSATGGDMFPAVTVETSFPESFDIQGDPVFVNGQPYKVQWTGATPTKVFLSDSYGYAECVPGPGGSLTFPASVTAHVSDLSSVTVMGLRESTTTTEISPSRRVSTFAWQMRAYRTQ